MEVASIDRQIDENRRRSGSNELERSRRINRRDFRTKIVDLETHRFSGNFGQRAHIAHAQRVDAAISQRLRGQVQGKLRGTDELRIQFNAIESRSSVKEDSRSGSESETTDSESFTRRIDFVPGVSLVRSVAASDGGQHRQGRQNVKGQRVGARIGERTLPANAVQYEFHKDRFRVNNIDVRCCYCPASKEHRLTRSKVRSRDLQADLRRSKHCECIRIIAGGHLSAGIVGNDCQRADRGRHSLKEISLGAHRHKVDYRTDRSKRAAGLAWRDGVIARDHVLENILSSGIRGRRDVRTSRPGKRDRDAGYPRPGPVVCDSSFHHEQSLSRRRKTRRCRL